MTIKKITITAALVAGMLLLSGCEMIDEMVGEMLEKEEWSPKMSSAVSVSKDGTVTEILSDSLDADYYEVSELENMIRSEVKEYNSQYGADSVQISGLETAGKNVTLTLTYASAEDYSQFNHTEFFNGSIINAQMEGYLFENTFKKVSDGVVQSSGIPGSDVVKEMDKQVLVVRAPMEVKISGEVLYISANADVFDTNDVNANGEQPASQTEPLVLPSNNVYTGSGSSFAQEQVANRVYIIYNED